MALEGLHHITAITGDAPRNVDFYARVLGLRLVKKTVNFDQPDVYHLYFGDERGTPGSILTFFEFPGAALGQPGDGMVHTIQLRAAPDEALQFLATRLDGPPRRMVGRRRRRARGRPRPGRPGRCPRDGDHRSPVLPLGLLPRAQRGPLRARQPRHRLRIRRADGDLRRGAQAAPAV